jgi:hypothetical protein
MQRSSARRCPQQSLAVGSGAAQLVSHAGDLMRRRSAQLQESRGVRRRARSKLQKGWARQSGNALNRPIAEITENLFTASFVVDRFSPEHAPDRTT